MESVGAVHEGRCCWRDRGAHHRPLGRMGRHDIRHAGANARSHREIGGVDLRGPRTGREQGRG